MNRRALGTVRAMARTTAFVGAAAILALGGFAALPDDEPKYLGDMPSSLEQPAAERPPAPRSDPGPAAGGPPDPVQGPTPVVPEAPAGVGGVPGERVPAPAADTSLDIQAGSSGNGSGAPTPGLPPFFDDIIDTVEEIANCAVDLILDLPDGVRIDCLTGLELPPLPALPGGPLLGGTTP
ncbi:hypothetical protein SAMN06272739_2187 [Blastococcus haudaquaticus]|uniref:Uncharacterized protein n=2 Tax=Blastococcus haudaquaticus TaxID=1938745 RepID=A0A286GVN1_9ACTN|nr:hypothetical protein SAMN06272739_2187 [Blastococcus haudaquaticus]